MDNPANPVFFNTFDPFDNPTPPPNPITKSSGSLTNSSSLQAPAHDVNNNVLQPSTANVNANNYPYLSSPLDSPSINPYPLPRSSFAPSPSPSHAPSSPVPPAYSSNSSSNSYSVPSTNSSSVPKTSPLGSPSLTSQSNGYPQLHQAPSPVPYGTSPIPNQSQPVQFHQAPSPAPPPYGTASPIPNLSQPRAPSPVAQSYGTTSPIPSSQSMYDSNAGMKYFQPPSSATASQPTPQPTPPQPTQQTQPSFLPTTTSQSPTLGVQKDLLEQMNKSINAVMTRLDSIENRLSFLEITTKEVLNNQRTISTQQRKLQDSVDTTKMPAPVPQHIPHQHVYEEPRKTQVPAYPQPPLQPPPTHSHISPPVIMPPPTSHSHMPALVPVTHIADRGAMDYKPSMATRGGPSQYDADLELAKKLQAEFDSTSPSSSSSTPSSSSSSSHASSMGSSYAPKPTSQPSSSSSSQSKSGHQECPICQTRVALADLEAHVEQHFEDDEAKRVAKPGEKQISKSEAKAGFFAKLFGPKPEDEKKPSTEPATPAPAATPSPAAAAQVPYTHTMNPAYNQRMGYYAAPGMTAASPGRAMYAAPYYGYPVQNVPRSAAAQPQPQQFLYYPNLDQNPQ